MNIKGTGVSGGIGIGRLTILENYEPEITRKTAADGEEARFAVAAMLLSAALNEKADHAQGEQSEILESHIMMLSDPMLNTEIEDMVIRENCNSEFAVSEVFEKYAAAFEASGDQILTTRASDMRDIKNNLIRILNGGSILDMSALKPGTILAGHELTASIIAGINPENVCGFISNKGGKTSHMAIIARSLGIPAVSGISDQILKNGCEVIVDGGSGEVIADPSEEVLSEYREKLEKQARRRQELEKLRGLQSQTVDGRAMKLCVNIVLDADIQNAAHTDADGAGLFRTEFLFMNRSAAPTEEEQFRAYKYAAEAFKGKPVIIRTLDVGGDKEIPYMDMGKEENPFLGWRAIRYCLDDKALFTAQLRAILRASAFGEIKIMLPMVAKSAEIYETKELIEQIKAELMEKGIDFNRDIAVGIMIETPSAAIMADRFAEIADFFSIGTNDLTQYVMAADRGNKNVAGLCSIYDPAVLRLIYGVAQAATKRGIPCSICGEAGADPLLTKFFIGCGIESLSMTRTSILTVKEAVRGTSYANAREKVESELFALNSAEEAARFLEKM